MVTTYLATDPAADALLSRDPFALLVGMLLDQQQPLERAFAGPARLAERLGVPADGRLDPAQVAAVPADTFADLCARTPAVHRFPRSMAGRIQELARIVLDRYDGDAEALWTTAPTGADLAARLRGLPGFGPVKAQIFLALLAKQRGVRPPGWQEAAGEFGVEGSYVSVADIVDADSLGRVRAYKQAMKAAAKASAAPGESARPTRGKAAAPGAAARGGRT